MKTIYFIAGLPRSGSTLLCNILNQNPDFRATATSSLVAIVAPIKDGWHSLPANQAMPADLSYLKLQNVLKSVILGFHDDIDVPYVFDKSRAWLNYAEMLNLLFPGVKFLVTVRDMRQVLASMEKLYRRTSALGLPSQATAHPDKFATVESRALFWAAGDQLVGSAYNAIKDALARGFRSQMHFIDYKDLTKSPKAALEAVYRFLELPVFEHDFEKIEQSIFEDDRFHGFVDLHRIRSKVQYTNPDYKEILGEAVADRFKGQELW